MKKIALLMAVLMVLGAIPGWTLSETLDGVIDKRKSSDLAPVQDAGKLLGAVMSPINKMTKPLDPVVEPVRAVKNESVSAAKKIVNTTWGILTKPIPRDSE